MITHKELFQKSEKQFYKIASAAMKGENVFPLLIPTNKQIEGTSFSELDAAIGPLYQQSKEAKGKGYSINWKQKNINGSKQSIPEKIYFETIDDYLVFIKKESDYRKIMAAQDLLVNAFPALQQWTIDNPQLLLLHCKIWEDILKVCVYFESNEPPYAYYIRELPIAVHSKFIEQNSKLLRKLLDILLPATSINATTNDFAERYFLKKVNVYTQIRILDDALKPHIGYDECSLTLEDAAWLQWLPKYVFIIENQICFLTFPKVKDAVAIFGEGFKSRLSKSLPWLAKTTLFCWFDLDAAGFEMLNMVREHYPAAHSFLMDLDSYRHFVHFSVNNQNKVKQLPLLKQDERETYNYLVAHNRRLEQEKISQEYVSKAIDSLEYLNS